MSGLQRRWRLGEAAKAEEVAEESSYSLGINIGALINTYTILGVPYYNYSIICPKALFQLLRPLH